jgi:hypothetical protein
MEVARHNATACLEYYYKATNFVTGMVSLWKTDARYDWTMATPEYFRQSITDWTCDLTKYHVKQFKALLSVAEPNFYAHIKEPLLTQSEKIAEMLYLKMVTRQKELELRQLKRLHKDAIRALNRATKLSTPLPRTSQTQE